MNKVNGQNILAARKRFWLSLACLLGLLAPFASAVVLWSDNCASSLSVRKQWDLEGRVPFGCAVVEGELITGPIRRLCSVLFDAAPMGILGILVGAPTVGLSATLIGIAWRRQSGLATTWLTITPLALLVTLALWWLALAGVI